MTWHISSPRTTRRRLTAALRSPGAIHVLLLVTMRRQSMRKARGGALTDYDHATFMQVESRHHAATRFPTVSIDMALASEGEALVADLVRRAALATLIVR